MKQLPILLISVILFSCSDNEIRYHIDEVSFPNDTTDNLTYLKLDTTPINGIVYCEFGENGRFIDGKRDGEHKQWYDNGQLQFSQNVINGKSNGVVKSWYENGQLKSESNYKNGKIDGLYKSYDENGNIKIISIIRKNILISSKSYFDNNQLKSEINYNSQRKMDGLQKFWYNNGQLKSISNYMDGEIVGSHKKWDVNGEIVFEINHTDNKNLK